MEKSRHTTKYRQLLRTLRETRRAAGFTQESVAARFGKHASFVSKIESGERRLDVVELADFCKLYRIRLSVFLKKAGLE